MQIVYQFFFQQMINEEFENSSEQQQSIPQLSKIYKATLIAIPIICFLSYRFLRSKIMIEQKCVHDLTFQFTNSLNVLIRNQTNRNIIEGIGQLFCDIPCFIMIFIWVFYCKNLRVIGALALFYLVRVYWVTFMKLPFSNQMIWKSPGFPSLTVAYDRTRDFFYSGHVGGMTVGFSQFVFLRIKYASYFAIVMILYVGIMLIMSRVHYISDILGGLFAGLYIHRMSIQYQLYFDITLSIPYMIGYQIYKIIRRCVEKNKQQNKTK